ncbi:uncharacterized protein N7496_011819 [Penicillium cataractarum]|uniref:Major facilitator superfamily (MFS) profile domain-containing protein n=1 Tax=Penicillium cataractarum TaxID=2100454 RepID=A0A9W9RFY9_9EURO|nr:uncharacterized protein N7496_011819 [Penicillium cataractarum]KAJ5359406.1 hypothetical protein N7496_011819 [Penicillium cataractarum]
MSSLLAKIPVYILSSAVLLGAFSRFTHGQYTPTWYAFQEYHMTDDGSVGAQITPVIDTLVGLSLIFGRRKLRLSAAGISLVFFVIGLAIQVHAGKEYLGDVALVTLAMASVIVSRK